MLHTIPDAVKLLELLFRQIVVVAVDFRHIFARDVELFAVLSDTEKSVVGKGVEGLLLAAYAHINGFTLMTVNKLVALHIEGIVP